MVSDTVTQCVTLASYPGPAGQVAAGPGYEASVSSDWPLHPWDKWSCYFFLSMTQLTDTKSLNRKQTLLQYITHVVETVYPNVLSFYDDLDIEEACQGMYCSAK